MQQYLISAIHVSYVLLSFKPLVIYWDFVSEEHKIKIIFVIYKNVCFVVLGQKSLVDCNSYISFNDLMVSNKRCQLDIFIILGPNQFWKFISKL